MSPTDDFDRMSKGARVSDWSDSEIHGMLSDADQDRVTREELDTIDFSTFDTTGVEIPSEVGDPDHLFALLEGNVEPAPLARSRREMLPEAQLFKDLVDARQTTLELVTSERFAALAPLVVRAFAEVRQDRSVDYTVLEPELNLLFLHRCWQLGAAASPEELNWTLINARKSGKLRGLPRATRYSLPSETMDRFSFAAEIALRDLQDETFSEHRRIISLDRILCTPDLAGQFDRLAMEFAPGLKPVDYRWIALSLRKARRSVPNDAIQRAHLNDYGVTSSIALSRIRPCPGLFWFGEDGHSAFVGVAENLRTQIDSMLGRLGPQIIPERMNDRRPVLPRLFISEMPISSDDEREKERAILLRKLEGSRLNFFASSLFNAAA